MKKTLLIIVLLTSISITKAQVSLENNYPASTGITDLAESGYKYFLMDAVNKECRIYNPDHSLWKIIALNVPAGNYLYDVKYVTETLFNNDNDVELVYTYYSYDTTLLYYTYHSKVINESGVELLDIPGCAFVNVIPLGSNGYKMLAYVYDYSKINWTVNTLVYDLPGTIPSSGIPAEGEVSLGNPYPNPSNSIITIPFQLPEGIDTGDIVLTDQTGKIIRRYTVDRNFQELSVQINGLPRGVYYYRLITGSKILRTGKLIHL